ncbi:MAG: T9SS type A sorting domain-containing protein [Bacteroidetes bacterium]|nr:T9SS type A sorting domain-containing protein [Bacteroidota bacterium]
MKNQILTSKVLKFKVMFLIFSLVMIISIFHPNTSSGQTTTLKGTVYIYTAEDDTLSVIATNGVIKFYSIDNQGNTVLKATATLDASGNYVATVTGTQDLYGVIFPNDITEEDYVASYYPGWLDFESADAISTNEAVNGVIDYDWGAVGKEIVERPSGAETYSVSGKINALTPLSQDLIPMVYLMSGENVIASAPVGTDGRYTLSTFAKGNYEVFTSIPGFASQTKNVDLGTTRGDINFNLDVYRGESVTSPVNSIADKFTLNQNYPNPFNPTTNINFTIPTTGIVKLTVYNSLGKEVSKLVNDLMEPGTYDIQFNAQNLASGIYYYTLQVGNNVVTKKMNLIK